MPRSRHSDLSSASRRCISNAMRDAGARVLGDALGLGSPKNTSIASPMNLSTVPPCLSGDLDISVRYSLSSAVSSSGCIRSVVAVKFTMSEKKIVSFLRSVVITTSFSPLNMLR